MTWRIHRGSVAYVHDLFLIQLRPRSATEGEPPNLHLAIYDVSYSPDTGPGIVAYLRVDRSLGIGFSHATFTDSPAVARFVTARGVKSGNKLWRDFELGLEPRPARFSRGPITDRADFVIAAEALTIEAQWRGLASPTWTSGPSTVHAHETGWSLMIDSADASVTINGEAVDGVPYPEERYRRTLGRLFSSCIIGLAEVHLGRTE